MSAERRTADIRVGLHVLRLLNLPMAKMRLLLNRSNAKAKLEVPEIERALQLTAEMSLPSDVLIPHSLKFNNRTPVVLDVPKAPITRRFEELADILGAPRK